MIQPGLERIAQLLNNVQFPWKAIHVAGTNGKGSICHQASNLLRQRQIRTGRFTSPHLIDRWDCIWTNGQQVEEHKFKKIEAHYTKLSQRESINASPFEILTATAFHLFNEEKIDVGVIEVGMGGKLDATNILNNQVVSVISKIARDHEGFLGNTLEEISMHKAGILRPNIPYIVNPSNSLDVRRVIDAYAREIGAGPRLTTEDPDSQVFATPAWRSIAASLVPFQRDNTMLAIIAVRETLKSMGISPDDELLLKGVANADTPPYLGRLQYHRAAPVLNQGKAHQRTRDILIDGAHNPDAAVELSDFVNRHERKREIIHNGKKIKPPEGGWPVTWVLAMTQGKDANQYLSILLRPGDTVVATTFRPVDSMPWVKPMPAKEVLEVAKSVQPDIRGSCVEEPDSLEALYMANELVHQTYDQGGLPAEQCPIVLTGSLYLVGNFLHDIRTDKFVPKTRTQGSDSIE